jgi:hypothetical protein
MSRSDQGRDKLHLHEALPAFALGEIHVWDASENEVVDLREHGTLLPGDVDPGGKLRKPCPRVMTRPVRTAKIMPRRSVAMRYATHR